MLQAWGVISWLLKNQSLLTYTDIIDDKGISSRVESSRVSSSDGASSKKYRAKAYKTVTLNLTNWSLEITHLEISLENRKLSLYTPNPVSLVLKKQAGRNVDHSKTSLCYLKNCASKLRTVILIFLVGCAFSFINWMLSYERERRAVETRYALQILASELLIEQATDAKERLNIIRLEQMPTFQFTLQNFTNFLIDFPNEPGRRETKSTMKIADYGIVHIQNLDQLHVIVSLDVLALTLICLSSIDINLIPDDTLATRAVVSTTCGDESNISPGDRLESAVEEGFPYSAPSEIRHNTSSHLWSYLDSILEIILGDLAGDFATQTQSASLRARKNLQYGLTSLRIICGLSLSCADVFSIKVGKFDAGVSSRQSAILIEDIAICGNSTLITGARMSLSRIGKDKLFSFEGWSGENIDDGSHSLIPLLLVHLADKCVTLTLNEECKINLRNITDFLTQETLSEKEPSDGSANKDVLLLTAPSKFLDDAVNFLVSALWKVTIARATVQLSGLDRFLQAKCTRSFPQNIAITVSEVELLFKKELPSALCIAWRAIDVGWPLFLSSSISAGSIAKLDNPHGYDFFEDSYLSVQLPELANEVTIGGNMIIALLTESHFESQTPTTLPNLKIRFGKMSILTKDNGHLSPIESSSVSLTNLSFQIEENGSPTTSTKAFITNITREQYSRILTIDLTSILLSLDQVHRYLDTINAILAKVEMKDKLQITTGDQRGSNQNESSRRGGQTKLDTRVGAEPNNICPSSILEFLRRFEHVDDLIPPQQQDPNRSEQTVDKPRTIRKMESIYTDLGCRVSFNQGSLILTSESKGISHHLHSTWSSPSYLDFNIYRQLTYLEINPVFGILWEVSAEPTGGYPNALWAKETPAEEELLQLKVSDAALELLGIDLETYQTYPISTGSSHLSFSFTQSGRMVQSVRVFSSEFVLGCLDMAVLSSVYSSLMPCVMDYSTLMSHYIDQSGSFTFKFDLRLTVKFFNELSKNPHEFLTIETDAISPVQFIYSDTSVNKIKIKSLNSDSRISLSQAGKLRISLQGKCLVHIIDSEINVSIASSKVLSAGFVARLGNNNRTHSMRGREPEYSPFNDHTNDFNQLSVYAKSVCFDSSEEESIATLYYYYNVLQKYFSEPFGERSNVRQPLPRKMTLMKNGPSASAIEFLPVSALFYAYLRGELEPVKVSDGWKRKFHSRSIVLWNTTRFTFAFSNSRASIRNPRRSELLTLKPRESILVSADEEFRYESVDCEEVFFSLSSIALNHIESECHFKPQNYGFCSSEGLEFYLRFYRVPTDELIRRVIGIRERGPTRERDSTWLERGSSDSSSDATSRNSVVDHNLGLSCVPSPNPSDSAELSVQAEYRRCRSDQGPSVISFQTVMKAHNLQFGGVVAIQFITVTGIALDYPITSNEQTIVCEERIKKVCLRVPKENAYSPYSALPLTEYVELEIQSCSSYSNKTYRKLNWPPKQIVCTYGNGMDLSVYLRSTNSKLELLVYPGTVLSITNLTQGPLRVCFESGRSPQELNTGSEVNIYRSLSECTIKNSEKAGADIVEYSDPLTETSGLIIFSSCVFPFSDGSTPMLIKERVISWSRDPLWPHVITLAENDVDARHTRGEDSRTSIVYNESSIPICVISGLGGKFIAPGGGWAYMTLKDSFLLSTIRMKPNYLASFVCVGFLPGSTADGYTTPTYSSAPKKSLHYKPFVSYKETYNLLAPVPASLMSMFSEKLSSPLTAESVKKSVILSQQRLTVRFVYRNHAAIHMIISHHQKLQDELPQELPVMKSRIHTSELRIQVKGLRIILREPSVHISPTSEGHCIAMQWVADSGLYWKQKPLLCLPVIPMNSKNTNNSSALDTTWIEPPGRCNLAFVLQSNVFPSAISETVLRGVTISLEDSVMRAVIEPSEFNEFTSLCTNIAKYCSATSNSNRAQNLTLVENLVVTETTVEAIADKFISIHTFTTLPRYELGGCASLLEAISYVWYSHVLQHIKQSWPSILFNTRVGSTVRPNMNSSLTNRPV